MARNLEANQITDNFKSQAIDEAITGARNYVAQFSKAKFPDIHPSEKLLENLLLRLSFISFLFNSSEALKRRLYWSAKSIGIGRRPGSKDTDSDRFIIYILSEGPSLPNYRTQPNFLAASIYRKILESQKETEEKRVCRALAKMSLVEILKQFIEGISGL